MLVELMCANRARSDRFYGSTACQVFIGRAVDVWGSRRRQRTYAHRLGSGFSEP